MVGIVFGWALVPSLGPVGSGRVLPRSRRENEMSHVLDPRHLFHQEVMSNGTVGAKAEILS
jgi:hypothetical protein